MKSIGWIFVLLAAAFLLFIIYFGVQFLFSSGIKLEVKILSCVLAVIALGTTMGRFWHVIKDLTNPKDQNGPNS